MRVSSDLGSGMDNSAIWPSSTATAAESILASELQRRCVINSRKRTVSVCHRCSPAVCG